MSNIDRKILMSHNPERPDSDMTITNTSPASKSTAIFEEKFRMKLTSLSFLIKKNAMIAAMKKLIILLLPSILAFCNSPKQTMTIKMPTAILRKSRSKMPKSNACAMLFLKPCPNIKPSARKISSKTFTIFKYAFNYIE